MVKKILSACAIAIPVVLSAQPSSAQTNGTQNEVEKKLEEGAQALVDGMRLLLKSIPWYGQPIVKPNGDIVIPRRDGPPLPAPAPRTTPSDEEDETKNL